MTGPFAAMEGKAIAIVGLERALVLEAAEALERAGVRWQASNATPARAGEVDGVVCAARLAADAAARFPRLLVVGTAAEIADAARNLPEGADFLVAPPLYGDELVVRLSRVLLHSGSRRSAPPERDPLVLAADDDPTTGAIVRAVISKSGLRCEIATDGRQALDKARELLPAAVILDVNMPFLDGFEVLAGIRQDARLAATPVVMLTSVQQEADVIRAFSLGADDYVTKPFNPMELLARLRRLVERK